ncbi:CdaR family transcriptional regulator [Paenibacillus crassostreae]|uniref:Sugar diacid utilization regulator n=1 Tax=Paenibacillus crassostreae TaxID=1763538 RepID=A0A167BBU9_9BACL|nr:sugar diacid recognition domain-containing protein [Paenibacillus crassostreae]AOZ92985.1 sugar diacid utilization regulator [Paenibacillus crassostreae]OAB71926.1 sugar diacid utilization regulator [Paenibacillus crassostreae]
MYELTHHQAQNIVDRMMKDIPYNINIMDHTGIIIGSGNNTRIGTLHHGAVKAIKQRKTVEINNDEEFVKKGINLPIELNGIIVGVVGISGEVRETRPFGNLVKSAVILLIDHSIALEKENLKNNLKQEFFNLIINSDTIYTSELINQALTYGIQLTKPSQVIYVESPNEITQELTNSLSSFKISKYSLCIIIQETDKIEATLQQTIGNQYPDAFISISNMNDTISNGLLQAKSAMRVLKGVYSNEKTIYYAKCEFIVDMANLLKNDTRLERLALLLEKNEELIKTLQLYLNCNLNANDTANKLMIHRNTLNYRLNKIHNITGKDPKDILELTELIFMLINRIK